MTRDEFIENINTFDGLKSFCEDYGCSVCDDYFTSDNYDEEINDRTIDWAREYGWRDLRSKLDELPTGYDFYEEDDWGEFNGYDDDDDKFEDLKGYVLDWGDEESFWDEQEEDIDQDEDFEDESEIIPDAEEEDDDFGSEEGCSMEDLFESGSRCVQVIKAREREIEQEIKDDSILFAV